MPLAEATPAAAPVDRATRDRRIRAAVAAGRPAKAVAAEFGVTDRTVRRVMARGRERRTASAQAVETTTATVARGEVAAPGLQITPLRDLDPDEQAAQVVAALIWAESELRRLAGTTKNEAVRVSALHRAAAAATRRLAVLEQAGVVVQGVARDRIEQQARDFARAVAEAIDRRGLNVDAFWSEIAMPNPDRVADDHVDDDEPADGREEQS